jgi:hypothetical protein
MSYLVLHLALFENLCIDRGSWHNARTRHRLAPRRSVRRVYEPFSSDSADDFGLMIIIYAFLHKFLIKISALSV